MIYPIVICDSFLSDIQKDHELFEKFKNFFIRYQDYWNEIFLLMDTNEEKMKKKYKKIYRNHAESENVNPSFLKILETLFNGNQTKIIKLDLPGDINSKEILNFLRKNNIDKIVQFPEYFNDQFVNQKFSTQEIPITTLKNENELLKNISSVTRFSKNILLIDSMMTYHFTTIQDYRRNNDLVSRVKESDSYKSNEYKKSLNKILKKIIETNLYKKELKVSIVTTIDFGKVNNYFRKIINDNNVWRSYKFAENKNKSFFEVRMGKVLKKFNGIKQNDGRKLILPSFNGAEPKYFKALSPEEIKKEKICWEYFPKFLEKLLQRVTQTTLKEIDCSYKVHEHKRKDSERETDFQRESSYFRGVEATDLDLSFQVRKGFDLFDEGKSNGLRADKDYYIKLNASKDMRDRMSNALNFPAYKSKEAILEDN